MKGAEVTVRAEGGAVVASTSTEGSRRWTMTPDMARKLAARLLMAAEEAERVGREALS